MQLKLKKEVPATTVADAGPRKPKPGKKRKTRKTKPGRKPTGRGRFILTIGDEGGILLFMRGSVVVRRLFAPSPQPIHTEAMVELMRNNPQSPLSLLVDVLDQQYVRQTFPPVSSLSVAGLIKRRLDRDFLAEDIKGSLPLGRDKTGRKEWNYLLVSLARTPLLQGWLDSILELPNEFKGILLLPVEATIYIQSLQKAITGDKPQPWQLLVSHHKVSGFRQVVMREGKLVFTRVTQVTDDAIPAVLAGNIEQEIINTVEYLRRLGFQDNATLDSYIVVSADVRDALDMRRFTFATASVLTPLDVSELLGLEQAALSADRFGDVVMASAISRERKRALKLSTVYADKLKQLYTFSTAAKALGALVSLLFLGLAAQNMWGVYQDRNHIAETQATRTQKQNELNTQKERVKGMDQHVSFKTAVVAAYDSYIKVPADPLDFVRELGAVITPEEKISELEWTKIGSVPKGVPPAPAGVVAPGAPTAVTGPLEIRVIVNFTGNYATTQEVGKAARNFMAMLKNKLPQYDVTHEAYPWEKDEDKNSMSLDQPSGSGQNPVSGPVTFIFHGPKKLDPTKPKAPAAGA